MRKIQVSISTIKENTYAVHGRVTTTDEDGNVTVVNRVSKTVSTYDEAIAEAQKLNDNG